MTGVQPHTDSLANLGAGYGDPEPIRSLRGDRGELGIDQGTGTYGGALPWRA